MPPTPSVTSSQLPPELVSLLGGHVILLHTPASDGSAPRLNGQAVECAVLRLDQRWPLRLGHGWRLCQCLQHDLNGWSWVIERQGRVVELRTIDDPMGLGRDGFPTSQLAGAPTVAPDDVLAAYLAAKQLRMGMSTSPEWDRIGRLARTNPGGFVDAFAAVVGQRAARLILESLLHGQPPGPAAWRRARRQQRLRRIRTPTRAIAVLTDGARRHLSRITHPTGLFILLVGRDGSGRSALARSLPELCCGLFRHARRYHTADPRDRPSYGRVASLFLAGYHWLDTALGGWLRDWPFRMRTGLLVREGGWWDLAADPGRYRLAVPSRLIRVLGALLPRPDIALILNSQATAGSVRSVHLDTSGTVHQVAQDAREAVLDVLESRAIARLGAGWSAPSRRSGRWLLPRGPGTMARAGLAIYQPVTARGLLGWQAARLLASCGAFRLLPRGEAPPREVRKALAPYVPRGGTLAVARTHHPGRYVVLLLDSAANCQGVAKVASDSEDGTTLDREATAIVQIGQLLKPPVSPPRVLAHDSGLLILEPVSWRPRLRPWRLDEDVAHVLGVLFRTGARGQAGGLGAAHGDCTPWNLLRTERGWVLIDWEAASFAEPAFFDVFHYIIQAHTLLGGPSMRAVLDGALEGRGWVGRAVGAYADGARLALGDVPNRLATYLRTVETRFLPLRAGEKAGIRERERLLERLEG